MSWVVVWDEAALRDMKSLPRQIQERVFTYFDERIIPAEHPRQFGKGLSGNKSGLWRYRVGDYRILCNLIDNKLELEILAVGHRKDVYD